MNRFWNAMLVAPVLAALTGPARAAGATQVPLRHISSEAAFAALKDTPGLDSVTLHIKDYSVSLGGTEAGIAEAKSRLAVADVPSRQLSIKVSFIHYERGSDGKVTERTVLSPLLSTLNHVSTVLQPVALPGGEAMPGLTLTPALNRDGTVTLDVNVHPAGEYWQMNSSLRVERRLRQDTPVRLLGVTPSENKLLRRAVESGDVVTELGPYTATYLDVTVHQTPTGIATNAAPERR